MSIEEYRRVEGPQQITCVALIPAGSRAAVLSRAILAGLTVGESDRPEQPSLFRDLW